MTPEHHSSGIPEWALRERRADMAWILENMHFFWPVACEGCVVEGRGAIVVDTTSRPTSQGNPFGYLRQEIFENGDDDDIKRMLRAYDPQQEFVVLLLKTDNRTSEYRVWVRPNPP